MSPTYVPRVGLLPLIIPPFAVLWLAAGLDVGESVRPLFVVKIGGHGPVLPGKTDCLDWT